MKVDDAAGGWSAAQAEREWSRLTGILDFGDRLDFVFLELADPADEAEWRRAIAAHCASKNLPFFAPAEDEEVLDWLERERQRGMEIEAREGEERPRSVYFASLVGTSRERFVLARI